MALALAGLLALFVSPRRRLVAAWGWPLVGLVLALIVLEGFKDAILWPSGRALSRGLGVSSSNENDIIRLDYLVTSVLASLLLGLVAWLAWRWAAWRRRRAGGKTRRRAKGPAPDEIKGAPEGAPKGKGRLAEEDMGGVDAELVDEIAHSAAAVHHF